MTTKNNEIEKEALILLKEEIEEYIETNCNNIFSEEQADDIRADFWFKSGSQSREKEMLDNEIEFLEEFNGKELEVFSDITKRIKELKFKLTKLKQKLKGDKK